MGIPRLLERIVDASMRPRFMNRGSEHVMIDIKQGPLLQ